MIGYTGEVTLGDVIVNTTNGRDFTPEEWAQMAARKIISIGDASHPVIREQAHAFRSRIESVLASTISQAIASDRLYRK